MNPPRVTFCRRGWGRIYVNTKKDIVAVDKIIKKMDEFEYDYLPDNFITLFEEYPELVYTHKFDNLDLNNLIAICLKKGIPIFCLDNGTQRDVENPIELD